MEKKYMKMKKAIIITMCTLICIMAVGYAAFATNLKINGTASIESTWKIEFTDITEVSKTSGVKVTNTPTASGTTATFNVDLTSPGDKIVYQITVANKGTIDAIINAITASETGSDAIKFEITGIKKGDKLAKSKTSTFNVTISYDSNVTTQPTFTKNQLIVDINYIQDAGQTITSQDTTITTARLSSRILKDNTAQADTNIDFSQVSSDTNGKGLYYTSSNTEDNKTTYYFRGNVTNNYVKLRDVTYSTCTYNGKKVSMMPDSITLTSNLTEAQCKSTNVCISPVYGTLVGLTEAQCTNSTFNGTWPNKGATWETKEELWRIIRINESGSIRIIREDSIAPSQFNKDYQSNASVGYMYGTINGTTYLETHANKNDSIIKTTLDSWYTTNLSTYSNLIVDDGFCGDRLLISGTGTSANSGTYGSFKRLKNDKKPQFTCSQERDLYTTTTSTKGNKALTNPIALITADEVAYAGSVGMGFISSNNNYLTNGETYWTMTPISRGYNYMVASNGQLYDGSNPTVTVYGKLSVRPVINLKSDIEITSGNGTSNNPYVIKVN